MYQSAAHGAVLGVAECLDVPLIRGEIKGSARRKDLAYFEIVHGDEVEDLYALLQKVKVQFPQVIAVSSGAILSTYQRIRVETVCERLGLRSLSYLWQRPQRALLAEMLQFNLDAIIVKTASLGLEPSKHLGKHLSQFAHTLFPVLNDRFGFHECGEGGEYETLVLDCPRYRKRLILDHVVLDFDPQAPSGIGTTGALHVRSWHTEPKEEDCFDTILHQKENEIDSNKNKSDDDPNSLFIVKSILTLPPILTPTKLPSSARIISKVSSNVGGIQCASLVVVSNATDTETAMRTALQYLPPPECCFYAHLYLSNMHDFAAANKAYANHFKNCRPPPSRVCLGLAQSTTASNTIEIAIDVDCCNSQRREALHVRSISHWAPVCIGPYCQANTIASSFVFVAGQIPLESATMKIVPLPAQENVKKCLDHCSAVLDCTQSRIENSLFFILYLSHSLSPLEEYHALPSRIPTIILSVPSLPMNASHELQLAALTHQAARLAKRYLCINIGPVQIAATVVTASFCAATLAVSNNDITALRDLITAANTLLKEVAGLRYEHWVRFRLFHKEPDRQYMVNDQLARMFAEINTDVAPAVSVIPVLNLWCPSFTAGVVPAAPPSFVALIFACDLQALDVHLWMHRGR
mmetsp:Transcript_9650/g.12129  ORF Transcript_9650/g.12129 Transcript_9650/m.12129 type:complete len:637 (+) Transcript_9650:96-2006(+)